jgi:integrase
MPAKKNPRIPRGVIEHPPGSGMYAAQYKDQFGKRHREQAGSPEEAAELYHQRRAEVRKGSFEPASIGRRGTPPCGQMPLREAIDRVLAEAKTRKSSWADDDRYGRYWKEYFGARRLADVTEDDIHRYRAKRLAGKSARGTVPRPATVNRAVAFLKRVFNVMVRQGHVDRNPAAGVTALPEENEQTDYLHDAQEDVLTEHLLSEQLATVEAYTRKNGIGVRAYRMKKRPLAIPLEKMVELAIQTGLRQGEQLRIRREHMIWEASAVRVPRNKKRKQRVVKLNSRALELIREQFDSHASPWLYPSPKSSEKHISASGLENAWARSLKRAGLPHIRWHSLRATFTVRMLEEGADWEDVRDQLGHATLDTVRRYARVIEDRQRRSLERLVERSARRRGGRTGATGSATSETGGSQNAVNSA